MNVVTVSHDLDLVLVELGELGGDEGRTTVGDVTVGVDYVELLERSACGLGVEEVDEGEEDDVRHGEEEEGPAVDRGGHGGEDLDDKEVGEPVGHGRDSVGLGTSRHRVELGGVEPRKGEPGGTEERDEEVQTDGGTLCWADTTGKETCPGDEHGDCLADGSDKEELAATDTLDEDERKQSEEHVDDRKDTTKNERKLHVETDLLVEQDSGVVDDGVASTKLLEELGRGTDESTGKVLLLALLEDVAALGLDGKLGLDHVGHALLLGNGTGSVVGVTTESGDDTLSFGIVSMVDEPTRGLGEDEDTGDKNDSKEDLEGDRETPGDRRVDERQSKVHPVGNDGSDSHSGCLHTNEETTVVGLGSLGDPRGNGGSVGTVSKSSYNTADKELDKTADIATVLDVTRTESSNSDKSTDNHDKGTAEHHAATTSPFSDKVGKHGTEETSHFVTGHDCALDSGSVDVGV